MSSHLGISSVAEQLAMTHGLEERPHRRSRRKLQSHVVMVCWLEGRSAYQHFQCGSLRILLAQSLEGCRATWRWRVNWKHARKRCCKLRVRHQRTCRCRACCDDALTGRGGVRLTPLSMVGLQSFTAMTCQLEEPPPWSAT